MRRFIGLMCMGGLGCGPVHAPVRHTEPKDAGAVESVRDADQAYDEPTVTVRSATEWTIRISHSVSGRTATGEIATRTRPKPSEPTPHLRLVSAEAWRELAIASLDAGDPSSAVVAIRRGLDELGDSYSRDNLKDDTVFTITSADEQIDGGLLAEGATVLLRVLKERIDLYYEKFSAVVRRP